MNSPLLKAIAAGLLLASLVNPVQAEVLITPQEAALPAAPDTSLTFRGVTRGPKVQLVSPSSSNSPMKFVLKFESFGGSKIDLSSVKVSYLKSPTVDITARIAKFMKETGVEIDGAIIPPGDHVLKVDLKDDQGRIGSANIKLKITN